MFKLFVLVSIVFFGRRMVQTDTDADKYQAEIETDIESAGGVGARALCKYAI